MIVLAVGMPRAGSGWHYNLIHDLVVANGGSISREIRQKYHLENILTEVIDTFIIKEPVQPAQPALVPAPVI
jgi:hypothetical protein